MEEPDFWDDPESSQESMKTLKSLKDDVETYAVLQEQYEEIETLIEMANEENDASLIPEIQETLDSFITTFDDIRIRTLLSGEYDRDDAIVTLHAGAGGTESCDWAGMLYRMYTRWADKKGYSVEVLDYLDGEEAGIKSVTFEVRGENAYGYLKSEKGVHRLVRILRRILTLRSATRICASTPTAPAAPADSISTRHPRRSVSRICPRISWCSARMSAHSFRIRIRRCRCSKRSFIF